MRRPLLACRRKFSGALLALLVLSAPCVAQSSAAAGKELPFTLRAGDVLANAPLGVRRDSAQSIERMVYSPMLGVRRPTPPVAPPERLVQAPLLGVLRGAGVDSLAPARITVGQGGTALQIRGVGLSQAVSLQLTPAEGVIVGALQIAADGRELSVDLLVDADAVPGVRRVRLIDAAGRALPVLRPEAGQLLLAADPPIIESIAPGVVNPGDAFELLIRGRFLRGIPQAKSDPDRPIVRIEPAAGISVGSEPVFNTEGTEVRVPIVIGADAAVGARRVEVETANGLSDASLTPANTLNIIDTSFVGRGPFVSPLLGVRRGAESLPVERLAYSLPIGVVRGPFLSDMQPRAGRLGEQLVLRLAGRGLSDTTGLQFAPADGVQADLATLQVSDDAVEVSVQIAADAPLLARRVTLLRPDGELVAPHLLDIRDVEPVLTSLRPSYLLRNGLSQTIELQGSALSQTTAVALEPDNGLIIESYEALSATNARMVLRASPDSTPGGRVVRVRSASAVSSAEAAPGNTLYVRDAGQIVQPVVSPVLGVRRGADTQLPRDGLAVSSTVSVLRGIHASSLTPAQARRGISTRMRVVGRGLAGVDRVEVESEDGLGVSGLGTEPDGSTLEFDLGVAADAQPGMRRVRLFAGAQEILFAPREAGTFLIADNSADVPEGRTDRYTLDANNSFEVGVPEGVLANDIDPQGGQLVAVLRRLPAAGTLNLRSDGSFVYTPNADTVGTDRFEYSPANAEAIGNTTVVTLVVSERDDAVDDIYLTPDNRALEVDPAQGLLANDRISAGATTVAIVLESQPSLGSLNLAADGSFTYLPSGTPGNDSFRYRLEVDGLRSLPASVSIAVQDINDPPIAEDDGYVTDRDVRLEVPANRGVLANDRDPDGDTLQARVVVAPTEGSLSLQLNGSLSFVPPPGFVGEVGFRYEVFDGRGGRAEADARITVNDTLAAADDAYSMNEGEVLFVDEVQGVLANDSVFPQGDLRVELVQAPELGDVALADDGSFVYTLEDTDVSGVDEFRYRLVDDRAASPSARVRITIRGVNDAPVGVTDRYIADENARLLVAAPGVLANDRDVEDDPLSAELVRPPEHGVITLQANGGFSYVPEVNFRGPDSFEYAPRDATDPGAPVLVEILVSQPPTATNDVYLVDVDTPLEIIDPDEGLLVNDHDAPEDDPLFALIDSRPRHGDLLLNENGTFLYTPDPGYSGLDVWTYQVSDGQSESNVGTVTMAVGITSLPRAVPDEYEALEDTPLVVPVELGVLVNDLDADTPREQLEADLVGGDFRNLSVTLNDDGSFTATPRNNFVGETFFIYQVYDGRDISNGARVRITVSPVNDGVLAEDDSYGVLRNTVLDTGTGNVRPITYNDRYDPSFAIAFEIVEAPSIGSATINAQTGRILYTPGLDFAGTDRLRYRVYQVDTGIEAFAYVNFRVNGPPVAVEDRYTATEDQVVLVTPSPLANDYDPDGDPIALTQSQYLFYLLGYHVRLTVDDLAAPTQTQIQTSGHFYGEALMRYSISDGTARDDGEIVITVLPVPDDPVANADDYLTLRDTPLSIGASAQGVLGNDFDPDARPGPGTPAWPAASGVDLQPLRAELVQGVAHGTLTFNETGTFYYVPASGFSGSDRFRYRSRDATGRVSSDVEVRIRVNSPAQATDDAYVATEDVPLVISAAEGLLINDSDIDGDPMRASFASSGCAPCNGRVQINIDGSFRYTPDRDFHGEDFFFYSVRDGVNGSDTGRVDVTVLPVNDPPITDNDTYRTREDELLIAPEAQGVLRNDREVDGDGLDYAELVEPAEHGSVAFERNGSFTFTPDPDFNGTDGFRYRVFDTTGLSAEATVEVFVTPVNDPPATAEDRYTTRMDRELLVSEAEGVLANDSDVDGPGLRASLVGPPQHGQLSLQPNGGFRYRPNGFFSGVDQFRYQVDDGLGALATGTALIQVTAVDPEVELIAENDFYRFPGPRLEVAAPGVTSNDRIEGAPRETLSVELAIGPEQGLLSLEADGSFSFQAPDGFSGLLGFTYTLRSGQASAIARVSLDVQSTSNAPPQARGENYGVLEDGILDTRQTFGLLANDSDFDGNALQLEVLGEAEHGVLDWLNGGHFIYRPQADFHGEDRIRYRLFDGLAYSQEAQAVISVFAQNDPPVAEDDAYRVQQDVQLVVGTAQGVLANDLDPDGDALLVELVDQPDKGQLLMDPEGGFSYQPLPGASGEDSFRYAASDLMALDTATVRLNITRNNRPPSAQDDQYTVDEDGELDGRVSGSPLDNDVDPDGDTLTLRVIRAPQMGLLRMEAGQMFYRPQRDSYGRDGFSYVASDGEYDSPEREVVIDILPINDAPEANTDLYTVRQDALLDVPVEQGVLANDRDVEHDPLRAAVYSLPSHGDLLLQVDGSFRYQPRLGFAGRDEFSYQVADAADQSLGRVVVDVLRSDNARPLAQGERFDIAEDTPLDTRQFASLLANDRDPEGQPLQLIPQGLPDVGTAQWLQGGHLLYTPPRDHVLPVEIRYAVSDGELESAPVSVQIFFAAQNDPPQANADVYYLDPSAEVLRVDAQRGLLANDRDPDGDTLLSSLVGATPDGSLKLRLDGSFDYLPDAPRPAQVSFRYRAADATGSSSEAEVLLFMEPQLAPLQIFTDSFESRQP